MDNNIGKKLDGRYELLELIGVGGMADIYRARDVQEDRIVAVKILKTEFAGSEEFLRRFRNESKAIALLSHPNIVKIYDVGFTDKVQFIVMEYVDGITLTADDHACGSVGPGITYLLEGIALPFSQIIGIEMLLRLSHIQ